MKRVRMSAILAGLLAALFVITLVVLTIGYVWVVHMPGEDYQGRPPPLTADDRALKTRLHRHVQVLAARIGERNHANPANLRQAAEYIEQTFREAGFSPLEHTVPTEDKVHRNIEVIIPGADEKVVVVGAHYDTALGTPGADDNGSGVAVLLELARLLRHAEPRHTLRLVAFVNEELPFARTESMGSLHYARRARADHMPIVGMISLEMLGFYTGQARSQRYPPGVAMFYPAKGNFVAFVGNVDSRQWTRQVIARFREVARVPSEGMAAPNLLEDIGRSDHWAFWQMGYPALMLTDTANFRNPHYHRPSDTIDTLDFEKMTRVTRALAQTLERIAQGRSEPTPVER